jgi:hypothetical protein
MASTTLTTPSGLKVRSASQRRYVLVAEYEANEAHPHRAHISKRSDKLSTLRTEIARSGRVPSRTWHIFDTVTKEKVA